MEEKKRKWIVTSAWPYVNATPHLGNMIGSVLSADVFARYARAKKDEVVLVSGSDQHGTPVAVSAIEQNMSPEDLAEINHKKIADLFEKWNISYDNYTKTHNPVHIKFCQDFYIQCQKNGYVSIKDTKGYYCEKDEMYLPDRFIEGTCPECGSEYARGDQCDACGKLIDSLEIINPKCKICGSDPIVRDSTHWYLDFNKVEEEIADFIKNNNYLPDNARKMSLNFLKEGLPSRAITRDLKWGIPATFKNAKNKSIYVWFEAVLGYISAVKQWAIEIKNDPDKFKNFWNDPDTKAVYFIGKDNIIFHLIIFPGLIAAYNKGLPKDEQFVMPYNVSSTEFLNYEDTKFSKSRQIGIWIDEALELAPVEYWRYTLLRNRPEKQDSRFIWEQFEKDILELNDIIGNFIHRTLTFITTKYDGKVPIAPPDDYDLSEADKSLINTITTAPDDVGIFLEEFKIKDGLNKIINIARQGNIYLNSTEPWKIIKQNKEQAGYVFYHSIQLIRTLAILMEPFIPSISVKIMTAIGSNEQLTDGLWDSASNFMIPSGTPIPKPKPFFRKLEIKDLKEKLAKMHGHTMEEEFDAKSQPSKGKKKKSKTKPLINFKQFQKLEIKIVTILDAEPVHGADKLVKLTIDAGEESFRTLVAGIAKDYNPDSLIGTQVVLLANLQPRTIFDIESQGMLLAADGKKIAILRPDKSISNGSKIE